MPTQNTVKQHITTAVRKADLTSVSAKQIRRSVEKELNLAENALSNETWKALVKEWILDATVAIERGDVETDNEDVKEVEEEEIGRSLWVCGGLIVEKKGRRKKAVIQDTPESSPVKAKSPKQSPKQNSPKKVKAQPKEEVPSPPMKKRKTEEDNVSDSDMSVLIDS